MEEAWEEELKGLDEMKVECWISEANVELRSSVGIELPAKLGPPRRSTQMMTWGIRGIKIPTGALFYPSCRTDLSHAIAHFTEAVESLHFADVYISPLDSRRRNRPGREISVRHVGTVVPIDVEQYETGVVDGSLVHYHASDGLIALVRRVPDLSIFYYTMLTPFERARLPLS